MAIAQIRILSRHDIVKVHETTLKMLEDPGVAVHSENALKLLEEGGATVDFDSMKARIPEGLVKEILKNLPKTMRFGARNPRQDMVYPHEGAPYMATNGTAVYMTDLHNGERRTTTGKDLADFMKVCDAMDALDYVWPIVTAHDAPDETHALSELAICLQNTTKHVQGEAMSAGEARAEIEVAAALAGGEDALAKRPLFSVIQCPICPLEFERGSIDATIEFAKAGIPVVSMSMALMGLTSPVSLASTIAIVNAENLASFAISQLAKKGSPVVYSSESTSPDMMTGEIHYGALEEILLASAASQMADSYGAASMVGGFGLGIGGEKPGIHLTPAELLFTALTSVTGTDFASGIGGLDQAKGSSLEQIVTDCDLWECVRELVKDVSMDDEHFALDLVKTVGPGGTYLRQLHTVKNMKKEMFIQSPDKARNTALYVLSKDWDEAVRSARVRVERILAEHKPEPIDSDTKKRIDKILAKHQRR